MSWVIDNGILLQLKKYFDVFLRDGCTIAEKINGAK